MPDVRYAFEAGVGVMDDATVESGQRKRAIREFTLIDANGVCEGVYVLMGDGGVGKGEERKKLPRIHVN